MSDCLQTGELSWCIINTEVNLVFFPLGVVKSSTSLLGWRASGVQSPVSNRVNCIRQKTLR